jgi:hypothetical protein
LKNLKSGDFILCEDGIYHPIKSIVVTSGVCNYYRLSNRVTFHLGTRGRVSTTKGLKLPEMWDTLILKGSDITPMIIDVKVSKKIIFFHDILIDVNIVSPEGIVFKYGD